jgi:formylglycine-generating enzyme required for sulfatase activity
MGSAEGRDDEKHVHRVWIDAFDLATYQTTNADYALFVAATRHPSPPGFYRSSTSDPNFSDPRQPVVSVSWHDAIAYCTWLSSVTGRPYRLPTEAEWERAARGGVEDSLYPWGNEPPDQIPNYSARWKDGPEPVGLYAPNPYGLYNLGDNVHEWCADWYDAGYYANSPERNPRGPDSGNRKASRGGSWRHHIRVTRTAARSSIPPEFKYADYGFRVACSRAA